MNKNQIEESNQRKTPGSRIGKTLLSVLAVVICFFSMIYIVSSYASPDKFSASGTIPQMYTILESEGGTYYGPVIDYAYSGAGEFQYLAGGVYEGDFGDSQREGTGTFSWENGDIYTGQWADDNMINGTYTFADGRAFTGSFSKNRFENGEFTVSQIPEELGLESFSATYAAGKVDAVQFETADGIIYSGQITGSAEIQYPSGNVYSGEVVNGVRSGVGTFVWAENGKAKSFYEGNWKNGFMSGQGIYHYTSAAYPCIKGTFKDGLLTGIAVYSKEAGNTFSTTWENGVCTSVKET